jgi:hypothetical protein
VAAGVAVTAAGGALFSGLRARSGGLTAPVLLHLATNCSGLVVAWTVAAPARRAAAAAQAAGSSTLAFISPPGPVA